MALTPGTRLGVYEVTAQIGEGGIGQEYWATHTELKRQGARGIPRVPANGGPPERPVSVSDGEQAHGPQMLSDGQRIVVAGVPASASGGREEIQVVLN